MGGSCKITTRSWCETSHHSQRYFIVKVYSVVIDYCIYLKVLYSEDAVG